MGRAQNTEHRAQNSESAQSAQTRAIVITQGVLSKNDLLAQQNRRMFKEKRLLVLNVVSSPGSGKTALIQ